LKGSPDGPDVGCEREEPKRTTRVLAYQLGQWSCYLLNWVRFWEEDVKSTRETKYLVLNIFHFFPIRHASDDVA
jgi:hypothetical protein